MPCRPAGFALAAALAMACHGAVLAQTDTNTTTTVPAASTVTQLAPQLIQFAGSQTNFESLVNGLAQGTQVQITTVLPEGFTQIVTFTPTTTLTPTQIAQTLETTRQQLIGLGIGAPTAEQIGVALMGGRLPTALGGTQVAGTLPPAQNAATGATSALTNSVNVQLVPNATTTTTQTTATTSGVVRNNTSDSNAPAGVTSRSPAPANTSNSPTGSPAPPPSVLTPFTPEPAPGTRPPSPNRPG